MHPLIYNKANEVWKVLLTIDTRINNINTLIIKQPKSSPKHSQTPHTSGRTDWKRIQNSTKIIEKP